VKTSYNRQYLKWWDEQNKDLTEEDFGKIYVLIKEGNFEAFLDENYPARGIPEPKPRSFIHEILHPGHVESEEEDSEESESTNSEEEEEEIESSDRFLIINDSSENQTTEAEDQSNPENSQQSKDQGISQNQPEVTPSFPSITNKQILAPPPPKTKITSVNTILSSPTLTSFSGYSTPPRQISNEYDADTSESSPEDKNKKTVRIISPKQTTVSPSSIASNILLPPSPPPILTPPKTQIFVKTNKTMSASTSTASTGKGKGHIKYQEKIGSKGAYIEVTGIKDEDTNFTVKGMPFYRRLDNTEEWVTPHNSNWILPEETAGKLDVPMDLFMSPKYASKSFKEVEEQRLQELYVEFKKFEKSQYRNGAKQKHKSLRNIQN
jgi:hypothetical protein